MKSKSNQFQAGVALIEVLVSAVVFVFGLVGILNLQTTLFKAATNAQARSSAVQLAEEKLEDLRRFSDYDTFAAIGNDVGGTIAATSANSPISINNNNYTRNWTATDFYLQSDGAVTTDINGPIVQKAISIVVGWLSPENIPTWEINGVPVNQSVTLRALIGSNSSVISSGLVFNEGGGGRTPEIPYAPSNNPNITTIRVGENKFRETMIPLSTTSNQGSILSTQFTAYTYNANNKLIRQEDFKNVACECAFNGTSQDSDGQRAYGPSYPTWDTNILSRTYNSYKDVIGSFVDGKPKGCVANNNGSCATTPDPYCDICCRDHHDSGPASARKFAAFRNASDFVDSAGSGNHRHYFNGNAVITGKYVEACRLKRIDGVWRVYQDWFQISLKLLPEDDLQSTSQKTSYSNYVTSLVDSYIDAKMRPNDPTFTQTVIYPNNLDRDTIVANRISMAAGEVKQVSSRSVYLDWLDDDHLDRLYDIKNRVLQAGESREDYLIHTPFYEVDTTTVSSLSTNPQGTIRTGPYNGTGQQTSLFTGQIQALTENNDPIFVVTSMRRGNSGLVSLNSVVEAVDGQESSAFNKNSHRIGVCIGCSDSGSTFQSCTTPWGTLIPHLSTVTGFLASSAPACQGREVQCVDGTLGDLGSYTYQNCTATGNTCGTIVSGTVAAQSHTVTIYGLDALGQTVSAACSIPNPNNKKYECSINVPTNTTVSVVSNGVTKSGLMACTTHKNVNF